MAIRNQNVIVRALRDMLTLRKINLEDNPQSIGISGANRYLQLPKTATDDLPAAAAGNKGAIVYDATTNSVKRSDGTDWANVSGAADNGSITNAKLATDVKVGSLATLDTTEKASVVGAINEVAALITDALAVNSVAFRLADISDTKTVYMFSVPEGFTADIIGATLLVESSVAKHASNYWTGKVRNITQGEDLMEAVKSTEDVESGEAMTQYSPWVMTADQDNENLAAGDVIAVIMTKVGSAADLDEPVFQLDYRLHVAAEE